MGRVRRDQFTSEESQAVIDEQGPLAALWNLENMMSWAKDESDATFGKMVKDNCPMLINNLEQYLKKADETNGNGRDHLTLKVLKDSVGNRYARIIGSGFEIRTSDGTDTGDILITVQDMAYKLQGLGKLFLHQLAHDTVELDTVDSNGISYLLEGLSKELFTVSEKIEVFKLQEKPKEAA